MSSKLYRLICVFIVIMMIGSGFYKSLLGRNSEPWEKVGFESLKTSMQKGLALMHWQWQYEGRPNSILYETSQAQRVDRIEINAEGWPDLVKSRDACSDFLNIFADSVIVEVSGLELDVDITKQLGISVEFLAQQELNDSGEVVDICRYSRKNQELEYHLGTGKLF